MAAGGRSRTSPPAAMNALSLRNASPRQRVYSLVRHGRAAYFLSCLSMARNPVRSARIEYEPNKLPEEPNQPGSLRRPSLWAFHFGCALKPRPPFPPPPEPPGPAFRAAFTCSSVILRHRQTNRQASTDARMRASARLCAVPLLLDVHRLTLLARLSASSLVLGQAVRIKLPSANAASINTVRIRRRRVFLRLRKLQQNARCADLHGARCTCCSANSVGCSIGGEVPPTAPPPPPPPTGSCSTPTAAAGGGCLLRSCRPRS